MSKRLTEIQQALEIRKALDTSDIKHARELLRDALKDNPTADIYYLGSIAALNEQQRIAFLQKAVEIDPFHPESNAALSGIKNPSLFEDAVAVFRNCDWDTIVKTDTMAQLKKAGGLNRGIAIVVILVFSVVGFVIVQAIKFLNRPTLVTLQTEADGWLTINSGTMNMRVTDINQIIPITESLCVKLEGVAFWSTI